MKNPPILERIRENLKPADVFLFETRLRSAKEAGWNVFNFPAEIVAVDLLSDSGTGALSRRQHEFMKIGDTPENRAYGMRQSFVTLRNVVAEIFGLGVEKDFVFFPFPQGRAAESVFFGCLSELYYDVILLTTRIIVPSNSHFDTTRANLEARGLEALDIPVDASACAQDDVFRGNMDVTRLANLLEQSGDSADEKKEDSPAIFVTPLVMMTITNNTRGGLPVSMENIRAVSEVCRANRVSFFFDAARFAENAYFIKKYEKGYSEKPIREIVREMFSYCDGFLISFKKDGLSHTGGGLVLKRGSPLLMYHEDIADAIEMRLTVTMSNPTQGAIPGGYQLAIAEGLLTAVTEEYLESRVSQVARFGRMLKNARVPVLEPFGGHAVYMDIDRFFDGTTMRRSDYGGVALTALLLLYGVRGCELGAFAFGKHPEKMVPDLLAPTGNGKRGVGDAEETYPDFNYLRLALPRRGVTDEELAFAVTALKSLYRMRRDIPRAVPIYGAGLPLRHMKARFELQPRS